MKHVLVLVSLVVSACGPGVSDKDKKPFNPNGNNTSANNTATNSSTTSTNSTTGVNNVAANNVAVNNVSPNNTNPNNVSPNNTTTNNTNPNNTTTNNTNPNNNTVPTEIEQKCARACDMLWGSCVQNNCSLSGDNETSRQQILAGCLGTGGDAAELCTSRYQTNSDYRALVDEFSTLNCASDEVRRTRCELFGTDKCSCLEPALGGPCTTDGQCDGGELPGYCLTQDTDGSSPGGQCLAGGCLFDENSQAGDIFVGGATLCGDEGACYVIDPGNSLCLPTCTRNADCDRGVTGPNQSGYSCSIIGALSSGATLGICQSSCGTTRPCGDGAVCSNLGTCEFECTSNADCPSGFNCSGSNASAEMHCKFAG